MRRFHEWFCRVFLGRTPKMWVGFGQDGWYKRRGYYELNEDGTRGVFVQDDGQVFI